MSIAKTTKTVRPIHPGEMLREDFLPDYLLGGVVEPAGEAVDRGTDPQAIPGSDLASHAPVLVEASHAFEQAAVQAPVDRRLAVEGGVFEPEDATGPREDLVSSSSSALTGLTT